MSDTPTTMGSERAICGVDVVSGVLPGTPDPTLTRQWFITSRKWNAAVNDDDRLMLLTGLAGKANAYATYLMLQPDRLNWVKVEWVWF